MKRVLVLMIFTVLILAAAACSADNGNSDIDTSVKNFCPYCGERIGANASEYSVCPECSAVLAGDWSGKEPGPAIEPASEPAPAPSPDHIAPTYIAAEDGDRAVVNEGDIVECFSGKSMWLAFSQEDLPQYTGEDDYENGAFFGFNASRFENLVAFAWANDVTFGEYHLFNADDPSIEYRCKMLFKDDGSKQGSFVPENEESPWTAWFNETDKVSLTIECNGVTIYFRTLTFD